MAKTTTNYGLTKPERSDNYNVDVMGTNMDIIDAELKEHDNVVNGGAVKASSITSTGLITGNEGFKGNLTGNVTGSATSLNKTVTVGVSSSTVNFEGGSVFMIAPYVPGVSYTGSVKFTGNWGGATLWTWSGSDWSSQSLCNTGSNTQRTDTKTFSNVKCVMISHADTNNQFGVLYVPTYS